MRRIGIVGGSFNPVHIAHLIIADRFVEQMQLDTCLFVPAYQSPFKRVQGGSDATPEQRLTMVRRAVEQNAMFAVSDVEIARGGVSYTIDTIRHVRSQHPNAACFLLIGSDQAIEFVRWHEWEQILREAQLCIVRRPFLLTNEMEQRMTETLTIDGRPPVWISAPLLEISSTEIRQRVALGKTINYLTVKAVRDFIDEHSLYR
ncbi:MAG: nicotinate (nicotinamide) nucleotide adenylyltransferase [Candidatus Kapabacteria bacterium]|nr:nicotinate (nicotinamide) nucleotide adenylyltransferase [Candidatus Kapabacteria bacterium]